MIRTNLATNPSFETASGTVTVRTNLSTNPNGVGAAGFTTDASAYWTVTKNVPITGHPQGITTAAKSTMTAGHADRAEVLAMRDVDALGDTGSPNRYLGAWLWVNVSGYQARITLSGSYVALAAQTWTFVPNTTLLTAGSYGRAVISKVSGYVTNDTDYAYITGVTALASEVPTESIWGGRAAAGDFTYAFTGTANGSTSVQQGVGVAGVVTSGCAAIRSTQWNKSGNASLRLISTAAGSAYAYMSIPDGGARNGGTLLATMHLEQTITESSSSILLRLGAASPQVVSEQAPNEPGDYEMRLTYGALSSSFIAMLGHGGGKVGESVWWDDLLIVEGVYDGPYFDGSTSDTNNRIYAWTGTTNLSTSTELTFVEVVPDPASSPPVNDVSLAVPTGNVMTTAVLTRTPGVVPALTRTQPSTGFDSRDVQDYESPYGVPVTYRLVADYFDPAAILTVWAEQWANLTSWTGDTTEFAVASGKVSFTGYNQATITRTVPSGAYRVVIASITGSPFFSDAFASGIIFGDLLQVGVNPDGKVWAASPLYAAEVQTAIDGTSPITIDFLGTAITITGTGGSHTFNGFTSTNFAAVQVTAQGIQGYGPLTVGAVTVSSYPTTAHVDATSDTVTLNAANAWMVHPSNPPLSIPISSTDRTLTGIRTIGDITNPSASTEHQILGQAFPITTTSGPRFSNRLTVMLATKTRAQELSLNALLADGTPLLIQAPPTFNIGFDEGFYSVGDTLRSRFAQRPDSERRDFTLPLTQVQSPIVTVQSTGWSWAALAAAFNTWTDVAAAYNTWADVFTNNRKSGF